MWGMFGGGTAIGRAPVGRLPVSYPCGDRGEEHISDPSRKAKTRIIIQNIVLPLWVGAYGIFRKNDKKKIGNDFMVIRTAAIVPDIINSEAIDMYHCNKKGIRSIACLVGSPEFFEVGGVDQIFHH